MSRRRTRLVAPTGLAALALTLATLGGAPASTAAGRVGAFDPDQAGTILNILPPGQSGTVSVSAFPGVVAASGGTTAVDGQGAPTNFADQLEMYDALTTKAPADLTDTDLSTMFKNESFTPKTVVREEDPKAGVNIQYDEFGVPYITGATYEDTMYGSGYAAAKDRMFLMDVLRHSGKAELAAFAGDTPGNLHMDQVQLRLGFYTPEEAQAQFDKVVTRYGPEGQKLLAGADAFIAGINAAQDALCPAGNPLAPDCPAEYSALQKLPEAWTRADVVYVASLVGGIFGKGGGGEFNNALWVQKLIKKFGAKKGLAIYRDLREKNDPDATTTSTLTTPYGGNDKLHLHRKGVALPDLDGKTAPGTGAMLKAPASAKRLSAADPGTGLHMDLPMGRLDVPIKSHGISNAVLIGADATASGHPIAVFGPQTGYYTPQLWTEEVLKGPGVMVRGVGFAGTNLVVQIGRGLDYSWSATSASSDLVDTVAERLCNMDGSKATVDSEAYLVDGTCTPLDRFEHSYSTTPGIGSQNPPATYTYLVLRSRHGIVQTRTTVKGQPVAIVLQRSTYGHEVDSVIGFARWNDPDLITGAKAFQKAAQGLDFTFNWLYADDRDIAYVSSGLLPLRSKKTAYDLPRWGDSKYDWKGFLPLKRHPMQINPAQGYLASWNNKPAPGFAAADNNWGYGSVYRSMALSDRARAAVKAGGVTLPDVVGIMSGAATEDSRAHYTLPFLLKVIGKDKQDAAAIALLKAWVADTTPRVDVDRDGAYAHEQAIALFDTWWEDGDASVARDVLGDRLGTDLAMALPQGIDDHPRQGIGSAWNDVAWYGYVNKDLRDVLGLKVHRPYHFGYCGNGSRAACRTALRKSLHAAIARVLDAQGVATVGELTYDKTIDQIRSVTAGAVGVRAIDWQNRPTFQQAVSYTDHRAR